MLLVVRRDAFTGICVRAGDFSFAGAVRSKITTFVLIVLRLYLLIISIIVDRERRTAVCTYRPYILSAIRNEHIILYFVHIIYYGMEITPPDLYFYIFHCIFVVVEK